ncbi:SEC24 [Candida pseudojiufengensis]|uniref:SEC24 n=1 Tax=Candida pseudojiufengensis TaxID=497109 RepID=UPI0022257936|nr:SEC24 [Candida pseudojiufengensis]KAI5963691.1 SEC24 [Candida pseudojiufengensis]
MSGRRRAYPQPQYTAGGVGPQPPIGQPQQPQQPIGGQPQTGAPYGADQLNNQFQNMYINNNGATNPQFQQPQQQNQYPQQTAQQSGLSYDPYQPQPGATGAVYGQGMGGYPPGAGAQTGLPQQQAAGGAAYAGYGQPNNIASGIQFNALYTTDLSRDLPPPIAELSFQPPPITIPESATLIPGSKTANGTPDYFRSTLNVVPNNSSLLKKSKLPLALVVKPYNALKIDDENVPVTCDTTISRCRRCRGYINPFITLAENGRRWRCNFCNLLNDIPSAFEYDEISGQVKNKFDRVELNHSVVEFIAPKEYMARAPQPIVYVFIIDVSVQAVQTGLTGTITRTILESLDRIPNANKTARVAFIGVDSTLHYFRFNEGLEGTEIMVVADIDEPFLPSPGGLLVNLHENREAIEKLLIDFPTFFEGNANQGFALGPALKAGHKLISNVGGKLVCFTASLPNIGEGKLTVRDEASVAGKAKEAKALLTSADSFYKSFAVNCNSSQVTVDLFLTASAYQDVATLSNLPRYTAGQTHYYPSWSSNRDEDITKLSKEVSDHLSQDIALEAVLRVRGSTGFRMSSFYGNFFNRSSDLCSFPTFPRDQSYLIEMSIEETINKQVVYFQAAVLHSTSFGERRIRVMNLALPVSSKLVDIYASADQLAITDYFTHKAIEKALSSSLPEARDYLIARVVDILNIYRKELVAGNVSGASPLQISTNLRMLPLLLFCLTKHLGFRSDRVPSDHRAAALNNLGSMPIPQLIKSIYPTVYSLHNMPDACGLPGVKEETEEGEDQEEEVTETDVVLPEPINDSKSSWENYGLYLIDNGSELFLWVSGNVVPGLIQDVFGTENLYEIPTGKTELPEYSIEESEFNYRVRQIIGKIRENAQSITWKNLYVVVGASSNEPIEISQQRDLMALRMWASSCLVEDKIGGEPSYRDFLTSLKSKVSQ